MFTLESQWKDMEQFFIDNDTCEEAITWAVGNFRLKPSTTWKEVLDHPTIKEGFIATGIGRWFDEFDAEARAYMLGKLQDSRRAINFYLELDGLSDEEDRILRGKFEGKGESKEQALREGKIKRAKLTRVIR